MAEHWFVMTKAVEQAIDEDLPMYWTGLESQYVLRAVTYTFENGTVRTRKVWSSYSEGAARNVDYAVRQKGGRLMDGALEKLIQQRREEREAHLRDFAARGVL